MSSDMHDVCFILEGTYPYVTGGVSAWVHNLLQGLPELSFTGVSIVPTAKEAKELRYELPPNFHDLKVIFLHDNDFKDERSRNILARKRYARVVREYHEKMKLSRYEDFKKLFDFYREGQGGLTTYDNIFGREAWDILVDLYNRYSDDASFIDYFWTYRVSHLPIFKILTADIPRARVYHTVSNGYAGLLGVIAKYRYGRPLLLTEHGIYTKERKLEITMSKWIPSEDEQQTRVRRELGVFRNFWLRIFQSLGRLTYQEAEQITTIYEGNREYQTSEGADPGKIEIIPNGIDIGIFSALKKEEKDERGAGDAFTIGFVGRVVQIKDIKTLIRACKIVSLRIPKVKVEILGPTDEDPKYYAECLELVQMLELDDMISFKGSVKVVDYYPHLDLIVLTSVSEAQPLVILEANCAGIPAVASDVGACRDLLLGRTPEDKALGPSGIVTRVADPAETADGIIRILTNFEERRGMIEAGRERVKRFYTQEFINAEYLSIYRRLGSMRDGEGQSSWQG